MTQGACKRPSIRSRAMIGAQLEKPIYINLKRVNILIHFPTSKTLERGNCKSSTLIVTRCYKFEGDVRVLIPEFRSPGKIRHGFQSLRDEGSGDPSHACGKIDVQPPHPSTRPLTHYLLVPVYVQMTGRLYEKQEFHCDYSTSCQTVRRVDRFRNH